MKIKEIVEYTCRQYSQKRFIFFASTNGTVLTDEMKKWFTEHKKSMWLGLSLDGTRETHNYNRSNSFDKIDIDYFITTWPEQVVKMTLSDFSLKHLAENVKYVHSLGFKISGVNLLEGDFDWSRDEYIETLIPQLKELVDFYVENDTLEVNQMFDKQLHFCEFKNQPQKKWCGIGNGTIFFDIDGKKYPCSYITPMTFSETDIEIIIHTDFTNDENFVDEYCYDNCYIYPICPGCYGASYLVNRDFKQRDKRRCKIQKLVAVFIADLQAKRIIKNKDIFDKGTLYYTIEAIRKIRALYIDELKNSLSKRVKGSVL